MLAAMLWLLLVQPPPPGSRTLAGTVVDQSGAPVAGARVSLVAQPVLESVTGDDGAFTLTGLLPAATQIVVTAAGFADRHLTLTPGAAGPVRIELAPRGLFEFVTVSANPGELRVVSAASATVVDGELLATMPALTLDEQLRAVPGFSLFRRSSSRVANPTTQGATLRGLAASGASRTLVLADGVPLNDPFGGWIYWDRLPAASVDRVEVARGGSSDLHGSDAVGGAIRIETDDRAGARLLLEGGSDATGRASGYGGRAFGRWQASAAAEAFTTDGFVTVAPESRGPIDERASSRHASAYAGAGGPLGGGMQGDLRASYFTEDRGNGTPFQVNATIVRQLMGGARGSAWGGAWNARGHAASQDYDQTFSAVAADRVTERPTTFQHVDTTSSGASYEWLRGGARQAWLVNASWRQADADLFERSAASPQAPVTLTRARQQTGALVLQGSFEPTASITVGTGVRAELWHSTLRDAGDDGRTRTAFLPRVSVAWRASAGVSLRASVHRAYRTPTINELYRPFRVGNVLTRANAGLTPEDSVGFEGAALVRGGPGALRLVGFWTRLSDAIVNVTLESGPALILRERQNAGRIRVGGAELEVDTRTIHGLTLAASAAFIDSRFVEGVGLEGLRVPQVPRWQAAVTGRGLWMPFSFVADYRFIGRQFDDDRNQFPLDRSSMVNARAGWRFRPSVEVFAAIENAFDAEQDVGRTPIRTVGLPRTVRVGVRLGTWR